MWDVEKKEVLSSKDLDAVPSALAWHSGPKSNTLASIGEDGNIHLWTNVIPPHMLAPSAPLDEMVPRLARSKDVSEGEFVAALWYPNGLRAPFPEILHQDSWHAGFREIWCKARVSK